MEPTSTDLTVREPAAAESSRALYLFRGVRLHPQARVLVVARSHPVERFVAAIAWWREGATICFKLAIQPGIAAKAQVCGLLIDKLSDIGRIEGIKTLQYAELLAEDGEWIGVLRLNGFKHQRSERFFEVSAEKAWNRTVDTYKKFEDRIPSGWRTESIRKHVPETIHDLIAPHRLMPVGELADHWRADAPSGFELDLSSILFDGGRPLGAMLARKSGTYFALIFAWFEVKTVCCVHWGMLCYSIT